MTLFSIWLISFFWRNIFSNNGIQGTPHFLYDSLNPCVSFRSLPCYPPKPFSGCDRMCTGPTRHLFETTTLSRYAKFPKRDIAILLMHANALFQLIKFALIFHLSATPPCTEHPLPILINKKSPRSPYAPPAVHLRTSCCKSNITC